MHFDLVDLRLFLRIAEAGSLTGGAARAGLSLAAVSGRVRALELGLGQRLLERGRRGVRLTAAGQALRHHAALVLQQVELLCGELAEHGRGLRGQVRLLCNSAALGAFLPDAVAPYLRDNPGIDLSFEERPSHAIPAALVQGVAEIGVLADHADLLDLEWLPFRTDRLMLAVPPGHRLARRRRVALAEVLGEDFVGLAPGSALQAHVAAQAERLGGRLRLRARIAGFDALCLLVARGVGLAIVPAAAAERCGGGRAFALLRLTDPWAERRLLLCMRSLAGLPLPARRLVAQLAGDQAATGLSYTSTSSLPSQ